MKRATACCALPRAPLLQLEILSYPKHTGTFAKKELHEQTSFKYLQSIPAASVDSPVQADQHSVAAAAWSCCCPATWPLHFRWVARVARHLESPSALIPAFGLCHNCMTRWPRDVGSDLLRPCRARLRGAGIPKRGKWSVSD